ncbi:hypothetical protein C362_06313 [Cryptococcus neoformans Bt1]|nr:hypothetical protein C362_06313 [Cryptococcus neoformans var. grubii Bt1]
MPPSLHDTIHHPPDRRALLISSIILPRTGVGASPIFSGLSFDHPCSRYLIYQLFTLY